VSLLIDKCSHAFETPGRNKHFSGVNRMACLIRCAGCGKHFSVGDHEAGNKLPCKACGTLLLVPRQNASKSVAWQAGIMAAAVLGVAVTGYTAGRISLRLMPPVVTSTTADVRVPGSSNSSANSVSPLPEPASSPPSLAARKLSVTEFDALSRNAIDIGVNWGSKNSNRIVPFDETDVTFSPYPSRFALIGNELFDLKNGQLKATIPAKPNEFVRVISPDGSRVAMHSKGYGSTHEILVYATQYINAPPVELPIYTSRQSVDMMHFLDENSLIGCCAADGVSKYIVWNTTTGKEVRTFHGESPASQSFCLSAHGKYLAIVRHDDIIVYDIERGLELARMTKKWNDTTIPLGVCDGLAFSPDGTELAASCFGGSQVAVWSIEGEIKLYAIIPNCARYGAERNDGITWLPDGSGWLLGGVNMVLRDNLMLTWQLGAIDLGFEYDSAAKLIDQNHVAASCKTYNGNFLAIVPVPWKQIYTATGLLNDNSVALVHRNSPIALNLTVETIDTSNKQSATNDLTGFLQKHLTAGGINVAQDSNIALNFTYSENVGKELVIRRTDGTERRVPTIEVATTASWTNREEILWSHSFQPYNTNGMHMTEPDVIRIREDAYRQVLQHYSNLAIPLLIGNSAEHRLPLQTSMRDTQGNAIPWKWKPEPVFGNSPL